MDRLMRKGREGSVAPVRAVVRGHNQGCGAICGTMLLPGLSSYTESGQTPGWESHIYKVHQNSKSSFLHSSEVNWCGGLAAGTEARSRGSTKGAMGEKAWAALLSFNDRSCHFLQASRLGKKGSLA
jgi:hypothetical protein